MFLLHHTLYAIEIKKIACSALGGVQLGRPQAASQPEPFVRTSPGHGRDGEICCFRAFFGRRSVSGLIIRVQATCPHAESNRGPTGPKATYFRLVQCSQTSTFHRACRTPTPMYLLLLVICRRIMKYIYCNFGVGENIVGVVWASKMSGVKAGESGRDCLLARKICTE